MEEQFRSMLHAEVLVWLKNMLKLGLDVEFQYPSYIHD